MYAKKKEMPSILIVGCIPNSVMLAYTYISQRILDEVAE